MTGPVSPGESTHSGSAWTVLALLSAAELLGMSVWFTASAVSPRLTGIWGLTPGQAGSLTTAVQLGFVAGTAIAAVLNLADTIPSRHYFAAAALLAALSNAAVAVVPGYAWALPFRFLTGLFLAGVYPPAMKMIATWFRSGRGFAIGAIVGALTVGKAMPYLYQAVRGLDHRSVILAASGGCVLAALLVGLAYRDGPEPFDRRPFSWSLVGTVVRHRETRLVIAGYLGHMWELYAMWSLIAVFLLESFALPGTGAGEVAGTGAGTGTGVLVRSAAGAFVIIAAGGLGSVLAGAWADRLGRECVTIWAMAASGTCALLAGWLLAAPAWLVMTVGIVWGTTIVADSAQFSAIVTEVAPRHAVGTALTLQTSLGFGLTALSIPLTIEVQQRSGWAAAFGMLAVGPALGIVAMVRLRTVRLRGLRAFQD